MVDMKTPQPTGVWPKVRFAMLDGAAAGDITLSGIAFTGADKILSVWVINLTLTEADPNTTLLWSPVDLTSEFSITATDTINNTGGTSTELDLVFVVWYDGDYGETVAAP